MAVIDPFGRPHIRRREVLPEDRDFWDEWEPSHEPEGLDDDSLSRLGINNVPVYDEPAPQPAGWQDIRNNPDELITSSLETDNLNVSGETNLNGIAFVHGDINHFGHTSMNDVSAGNVVTSDVHATNVHSQNVILDGNDLSQTLDYINGDIVASTSRHYELEQRIVDLEYVVEGLLSRLENLGIIDEV